MYRHILIPTDGSERATKAVTQGIKLAKSVGARATILTVGELLAGVGDKSHAFRGLPDEVRRQAVEYLEAGNKEILAKAEEIASEEGVEVETEAVEAEHAYEGIITTAEAKGADLIVMGSHGRSGVSSVILGSVTQKVLAHTSLPVLVLR